MHILKFRLKIIFTCTQVETAVTRGLPVPVAHTAATIPASARLAISAGGSGETATVRSFILFK
jgi:hypothetical protein